MAFQHRTVAIVVASSFLFVACTTPDDQDGRGGGPPTTTAAEPVVDSGYTDIVEQVGPSVVTVQTGESVGSGVVYRPDVVVTNAHVVGAASDVTVAFADATTSPGRVLATDPITDLAVIETERSDLPVPAFRESLPRPGEVAVAIGSPLGFENSVTVGIIKAADARRLR